ncbi:hypothetical protein BGW36DRAFT_426397 [Talaromyces proteolyticus]|uniref:Uncharacterized protein n=1 Tax=Talaromyces proteolyticus TaxID=1131652 RepID=A0AAD4KRB7_9EURO|nr:uncharacterized protein BGW36DRAFT_426397 [Talaromyces proteolyticus]KAH8698705.1 hypothetical protein BGW36DRAFT_426397 [Talaromyces proteolyticus]
MHFSNIILFAAAATAWTVPEGTTNGVYSVSVNHLGEEVHEKIAELKHPDDIKTPVRSAKFRRQGLSGANHISCFNDNLDPQDTDAANKNIDDQCGAGGDLASGKTQNGRDFYGVSGDVVAYVCNLSASPGTCYSSERVDSSSKITDQCGKYQSGEDVVPDRQLTYGYRTKDAKFCTRGTNGK